MLAKIWKKLLLAICIIACIYNVTAKLVNRHSLEENLKKANDGEVVYELPGKTENAVSSEEVTLESEVTNSTLETENTTVEESTNKSTSFFTFKFLH